MSQKCIEIHVDSSTVAVKLAVCRKTCNCKFNCNFFRLKKIFLPVVRQKHFLRMKNT